MAFSYVTLDELRSSAQGMTFNEQMVLKSAAAKRTASSTGRRKDTFLSHSSKDKEYLPSVIRLLESHGASVYCDLDDDRMPEDPNPETAQIIKSQIAASERLVVFVTPNSKGSSWVPWELGIGDAKLNSPNVALLPSVKTSYETSWVRQEYLGLYRHIVHGDLNGYDKPLWIVRDYRTSTATTLSDWCRGR